MPLSGLEKISPCSSRQVERNFVYLVILYSCFEFVSLCALLSIICELWKSELLDLNYIMSTFFFPQCYFRCTLGSQHKRGPNFSCSALWNFWNFQKTDLHIFSDVFLRNYGNHIDTSHMNFFKNNSTCFYMTE